MVPSLKSLKSVRDSNTNIGKSTVSPTSQQNATARSGVNPVVLAFRIDKLEAELKKLADYEYQVEDLQKQIMQMRSTIVASKSDKNYSPSISPTRSDNAK